jgi:hypothetical protein
MKRSPGVTAAAIVLLIGSVIALLFTALALIGIAWASTVAPQSNFPRQMLLVIVVMYAFFLCVEAFGIFTGIGLLRLKNWARITTIVFAVCIILQSLFSTLIFFVIPLPPQPHVPPHFNLIMRGVMVGFGLLFLSIGVWWLALFTRRSVRAQFQSAPPPVPVESEEHLEPMVPLPVPKPGRVPVVVIVVAVLLLAGTPSLLLVLFLPFPAMLMGKILYGTAGKIVYLAIGLIDLTLGIGLLRLKSWSLPATIAFYVFSLLNSLSLFFPTSRDAYFAAIFHSLPFPVSPDVFQFSPHLLAYSMDFGLAFGTLFCVALIVLLLRTRPAFERAARERAATSS